MPTRKPLPKLAVKAIAKAQVGASYHVTKKVSETIPADVTRAKSERWVDLFSPITEWTGLQGDRIRFQRIQLRIQQDATLKKLAESVREKIGSREIKHKLPPKLLVPALESASLEEPDSPLVQWWADLLVSGVLDGKTRLYFTDLMSKIGLEEAGYLEDLWKDFSRQFPPNADHASLILLTRIEGAARVLDAPTNEPTKENTAQALRFFKNEAAKLVEWAYKSGVAMQVVFSGVSDAGEVDRSIRCPHSLIEEKHRSIADIALALRLLEIREADFGQRSSSFKARIMTFTTLGIEFMTACRPPAAK